MRFGNCQFITIAVILVSVVQAGEDSESEFHSIDLQTVANFSISTKNQLQTLAEQKHLWDEIPFTLGANGLRLAGMFYENDPVKISNIRVDHAFDRLFIVHATKHGGFGHKVAGAVDYVEDGTLIGQYQVYYEDGLIEIIPIVYGEDVRDWWNWDSSKPVKRGKEIWQGETPDSKTQEIGVRLYLTTWQNPRPHKKIVSLTMISVGNSAATPFCVAMTTQKK